MRPGPLTMLALAFAGALPMVLLRHAAPPQVPPRAPAASVPLAPAANVDAARAGPWFAAAAAEAGEIATPDGTPEVLGIVGRLPDAAVVLVRRPDGGTATLAVGQAAGGWRLQSIAADAVLFVRGARRARVELPAG